ncbi:MAG: tRNA (adenosine(37)-N6)-threonylcarbamoyltransferase complex dimerization subunit type 1 TsaB [Cellvibrionales bacterium]
MPAMIAIDTSTDACSVAASDAVGLRESHALLPRAHNRHILAMIREVMSGAGLQELTGIVCGVGPGSFTGLRIATSVAQGLAWSLGIPVLPFCSLHAQGLAAISALRDRSVDDAHQLLSCIDTQTGQVYARLFDVVNTGLHPVSEPWVGEPGAVFDAVSAGTPSGFWIAGSGAEAVCEVAVARDIPVAGRDIAARPRAALMLEQVLATPQCFPSVAAHGLLPQYVQSEIGWKKLSEQPSLA